MSVINYKNEIKDTLDKNIQMRELLFRRGYLLTSKKITNLEAYPFYSIWQEIKLNNYYLYVQEKQTVYYRENNGVYSVIIGHAYNPFDMKYNENDLCNDLLDSYKKGLNVYFDKISEFTGLHVILLIDRKKIIACQDACSLTGCYYGKINNEIYISEHPQLTADLLDLKINHTVEELVTSKCYNIGNRHLPGDITPYDEIKRIGANTYLLYENDSFSVNRFFPIKEHPIFDTKEKKGNGIKEISKLIHNGIECCSKKWKKCTISLSGGTDSKTTLACANGLYDKFSYFSFQSKPQEGVDAEGAKKICEKLGLKHTFYKIPEENSAFKHFDITKKILQHNSNYFVNLSDNEIRKFIYLHDINAYDIELKSWASEVARVFFERKYEIKMPKILNERHCSIFQTRYFGKPKLLKWSDKIYYDFLRCIKLEKPLFNYEHTDLFYWEIRMGCWGVSVISSQQLYHRMTMPMNNRKILDLFLCFPHEDRKSDWVHKQIMNYMNKNVINAKVEIPNLYFHGYRIWMEKLYFYYRTIFYKTKK